MSNISGLGRNYPVPGEWPEEAEAKTPEVPEIIEAPVSRPPSPVPSHAPSVERRRAPRPQEAISAVLFSNSAFNGNIPCTAGQHALEGLGLERAGFGMGRLQLNVPKNTQLQVHSHAIDREPVAPLPPPASLGSMITGFISFWTLSAWAWVSKKPALPDLATLEPAAEAPLPRDGKLRIHGMEAAFSRPLTVRQAGFWGWFAQARITGASVDEHGRVTPRGEISLLGLFSFSLARFRDRLPKLNVEIEKLREGELMASSKAKSSHIDVHAICDTVAKLTGQGVFTVTRQPGAPPLDYTFEVMEPLRRLLDGVDAEITPVSTELNAKVKLQANASVDIRAHQRATTHVTLQLPHSQSESAKRTLRVQSDSRVIMPRNGAKWWSEHTVFVVDHSPTHRTDDGAWQPFVSGGVNVTQRNNEVRTDLSLRTQAGVVGEAEKSGKASVLLTKGDNGKLRFAEADASLPLSKDFKTFNVEVEHRDMLYKAARTGSHLDINATSRVVEIDRKKT